MPGCTVFATTPAPGVPWGIGWLRDLAARLGLCADWVPWDVLWLVQLFLLSCLAFHLLERFGPRVMDDSPPGPFHRGWFADLLAALINGPALSGLLEIAAVAVVLAVPALAVPGVGAWPWLAQFALFLVGVDFLRYWLHRAHHASDLLWRFHRVHHSARPMCFFTSFRFHLFEAIPEYILLPLPFKLLGVRPDVILVYVALDLLKGFWQHANWRSPVGWANHLLSSAEQHWWHHAETGPGMRSNFGSFLSIWDRLFGTFYWPRGRWPERIGVRGIDEFPSGYLGRFLSMVRRDDDFRAGASS